MYIKLKDDSSEVKGWKKKERQAFIAICKANGFDSRKQFGGRYGEMGPFQFLPSTWLAYGKDGNNDGMANPWDMSDAVTTVASYLKLYGYKKRTLTGLKGRLPIIIRAPSILIYFKEMQDCLDWILSRVISQSSSRTQSLHQPSLFHL